VTRLDMTPGTAGRARRIVRTMLPQSGAERRLLVVSLVDAIGSGLYLGGSAVFFTRAVGLSPRQIGVGLAAGAALGLCTVFPIGVLTHKTGQRAMLVALYLWRACGFASYAVVRTFPAFLVVVCLLGLANTATAPVTQTLVGAAVDSGRRVEVMAWLRAIRNFGYAVGALLVTIPVLVNTRPAYDSIMLGDAASFVVAAVMVLGLPSGVRTAGNISLRSHAATALRDRRYLSLTALNGVLMLQLTMLTLAIPLWLLHDTHAPRAMVGSVLAVNTILVVLLQIPFGRRASSLTTAGRQMAWAGVAFATCCLLVAVSGTTHTAALAATILVAAVTCQTLGEVLQSAGGWRISFDLAPEHQRGAYLGLFGLGTPFQAVFGPLVFTVLVIPAKTVGWLIVSALFVVSSQLVPRVLRHREVHSPAPASEDN
jgi:MFS family permease